jgi:hypothetical protein
MPLTADGLSRLSIVEICNIVKGSLSIPKHQRGKKEILVRYILDHADARLKGILEGVVEARTADQPLKRKRSVTKSQTRKAQCAADTEQDAHDTSRFLEVPSRSAIQGCYEDFYHTTSSAALEAMVRGVCAREVNVVNDGRGHEVSPCSQAHPLGSSPRS